MSLPRLWPAALVLALGGSTAVGAVQAGTCFCLTDRRDHVYFDCVAQPRPLGPTSILCHDDTSTAAMARRPVPNAAVLTQVPADQGVCRPCRKLDLDPGRSIRHGPEEDGPAAGTQP
jgi:hypothetical protein